jgi:hypothetical protein
MFIATTRMFCLLKRDAVESTHRLLIGPTQVQLPEYREAGETPSYTFGFVEIMFIYGISFCVSLLFATSKVGQV